MGIRNCVGWKCCGIDITKKNRVAVFTKHSLFLIIGSMKKTVAIIVISAVMLTLGAATYYVGADGGVTLGNVISGGGYRDYRYSWAAGYKASIPVVISLDENIAVETGVSMYGKYYRGSQFLTSLFTYTYQLDVKNGFLEFPLSFRVTFPVNIVDIYLSLGGFMGAWLYGSRNGTVLDMNGKDVPVDEVTDLSYYNRFDAGMSAKFGVAVNLGAFKLYLENEASLSLTDMNVRQKHGANPIHNFTYAATLGVLWGINK